MKVADLPRPLYPPFRAWLGGFYAMGVAAVVGAAVRSHWGIQAESFLGLLAPFAIYVGVGLVVGHIISKRYHMKYETRRCPHPAVRFSKGQPVG